MRPESAEQQTPAPWSFVAQQWGHPWHSMCSYLGSFPPSLTRSLISLFSNEGDAVLDPFSGRGTTLLEARLLNRVGLASDLNPIAYTLSLAKATEVDPGSVEQRIERLERAYDAVLYRPEARAQDRDIKLIYHNDTLAELCFLRRQLIGSDEAEDRFLSGVLLGIMHGSPRKDGSSAYASISMPNTFSMSPNYVRNYVRENGIERIYRNVFELLKKRVTWLFREGANFPGTGSVKLTDARTLASDGTFKEYAGDVDLVVTSPPYLNVVNYAKQNWIRSWLLSQAYEDVQFELDDNLGFEEWTSLIVDWLRECKCLLASDGVITIVVADVVKSSNSVVPLGREILRRVKWLELFEYTGCLSDYFETQDKTTRIWRDTKGQASRVERVIVLSDKQPTLGVEQLGAALPMVPSEALERLSADRLQAHAEFLAAVGTERGP